ncbi:carboxylesterase [Robbsia andropogonis]|uniref:Carboxylesterase n=1 Tax=Robbsia andropogonis TaxID=28092 RepID=A0A0F5JZB8_9BURK|nr:alpha/beta hydrolase [Robbsia andropogonis]KKB63168.1 carboxylesterase [Robbsia andropogonis]MCP1117572.1 alpha/beta hydrolase [Robbsia andropogonis]MCP1127038.1 alpha/beta hydrolase [Robbsia andropogonis]
MSSSAHSDSAASPSLDHEPPIEIETGANPGASVIWLHGLGADGSDFVPIVPELRLPEHLAVRFIFPHARRMPVTWNNGHVMRAWYDIVSVDDDKRHADEAGVRASRDAVRAWIKREEARGIPATRIIVAGFSQGGAIAYTTGMTHPEPLGGILALSTYVPIPSIIAEEGRSGSESTPVFAAHGSDDAVVPMPLGERACGIVRDAGHPLRWETYPMGHSVHPREIADIGAWLIERLG